MTSGPGLYSAVWANIDPAADKAMEAMVPEVWRKEGWSVLREFSLPDQSSLPLVKSDFKKITRYQTEYLLRWFGACQPSYKSGDRHWMNWKGSIYV